MIETGILTENDRVELLDGWILEVSPIGPPHATCVALVVAGLREALSTGWHVWQQSPITLRMSEPEPDILIARGHIRDYVTRHPSGSDIALVVEVADSSLEFDRNLKRLLYAAAGIPEYWIVNLIDRKLETYRNPLAGGDYQRPEVVDEDGTVPFSIEGKIIGMLKVAEILP